MIPKEIFAKYYREVENFTNICYNVNSSINLNLTKECDCMKRIIALTLAFVCLLGLCGCNNNADSPAEHEAVSADYGKVVDLAKEEFAEVFKEFEDVQIEETTTMARTDDAKEIVVQFKYSSSNGNGLYGFLYTIEIGRAHV